MVFVCELIFKSFSKYFCENFYLFILFFKRFIDIIKKISY